MTSLPKNSHQFSSTNGYWQYRLDSKDQDWAFYAHPATSHTKKRKVNKYNSTTSFSWQWLRLSWSAASAVRITIPLTNAILSDVLIAPPVGFKFKKKGRPAALPISNDYIHDSNRHTGERSIFNPHHAGILLLVTVEELGISYVLVFSRHGELTAYHCHYR